MRLRRLKFKKKSGFALFLLMSFSLLLRAARYENARFIAARHREKFALLVCVIFVETAST